MAGYVVVRYDVCSNIDLSSLRYRVLICSVAKTCVAITIRLCECNFFLQLSPGGRGPFASQVAASS